MQGITLALSKGRIFEETLPLLAAAGIVPTDDPESSRKLIIGTNRPDVRLVIVRASDTPTYVQYGAADLGIAGKDVPLEHGGAGLSAARRIFGDLGRCPGYVRVRLSHRVLVAAHLDDHFAHAGPSLRLRRVVCTQSRVREATRGPRREGPMSNPARRSPFA